MSCFRLGPVPAQHILENHKPKKCANYERQAIVAIILIISGIVVLAYSGITYTTPGEAIEFLGMRIETRDTHFIPPVIGALALAGGIVLLLLKPRSV